MARIGVNGEACGGDGGSVRAPEGLTLESALEGVPTWRLCDIGTCFGLWHTEGMPRADLIKVMGGHPMVTPGAVWSVLTGAERAGVMKRLGVEVKAPEPELDVGLPGARRTIFDLINGREQLWLGGMVRPLLSLLTLLGADRTAQVGRSLGVEQGSAATIASELERRKVPARRVLQTLTDQELRLAGAAWTLSASREELVACLCRTLDKPLPTEQGAAGRAG